MYIAGQVLKVTGLSYRQLDHVIRSGLLQPSHGGGHGRGTLRRFSPRDLVALTMAKQILESGHRVRPFVRILRFVQRGHGLPPFDNIGRVQVWTDGRSVAVLNGRGKNIPHRSTSSGVSYLLDLGAAARHVRRGVERLGKKVK